MFFVVRSKDSFNFPLGWIKSIFIVVIIVIVMFVASLRDYHCTPCVWIVCLVCRPTPSRFHARTVHVCCVTEGLSLYILYLNGLFSVSADSFRCSGGKTVHVCCVTKGLSLYMLYLSGVFSVSADSTSCPGQNCSCLLCHQGTIIVYNVSERSV